jgi:hypothetical protein
VSGRSASEFGVFAVTAIYRSLTHPGDRRTNDRSRGNLTFNGPHLPSRIAPPIERPNVFCSAY